MNNKKRLEYILKVREIRNNLGNLNMDNSLKEVLRRNFNYYENLLNLDIVRSNSNKEELDNEKIINDIELVDVPIERSVNKYQEIEKLNENQVIEIINKISSNIETLNFNELEQKVVLNSLKEYCLYLNQINLLKKSNQELYNEIMDIDKNRK